MTNLITLDGLSHFPKAFLDLKSFNSNKAKAIGEGEQSEDQEDFEQTAHGGLSLANHRASHAANIANPIIDSRLLAGADSDSRLIKMNARPQSESF